MNKPFKIIFVCSGNICRSPFGERVLQAQLDDISPGQFEISSAGTIGELSSPFEPQSAEVAKTYGADVEDFTPRRVTKQMIKDNDLVFALADRHEDRMIDLVPDAKDKIFLFTLFGRCLDGVEIPTGENTYDSWTHIVQQANKLRDDYAKPAGQDDVTDPWACSDEVFQQMADEMMPTIEKMVSVQEDIVSSQ